MVFGNVLEYDGCCSKLCKLREVKAHEGILRGMKVDEGKRTYEAFSFVPVQKQLLA